MKVGTALWKGVWYFLKTHTSICPTSPALPMYLPKNTDVWTKPCMELFIVVLYAIAGNCPQLQCSPAWGQKQWYVRQCTAVGKYRYTTTQRHHKWIPRSVEAFLERTRPFRESSRKHKHPYNSRKHTRSHVVKKKEGIAGLSKLTLMGVVIIWIVMMMASERETEKQRYSSL